MDLFIVSVFFLLGIIFCTTVIILLQMENAFFAFFCNKISCSYNRVLKFLKKILKVRSSELKEVKIGEAIIFAVVAILFPYLIYLVFAVTSNVFNNAQLYQLGGALQGLSAPFSAGIAAILTFIAFWTQYSANKIMIEDNQKQETTRRFYEMLNIHKENVSELKFLLYTPKSYASNNIKSFDNVPISENKGREIFHFYNREFSFLYDFICIVDNIQRNSLFAQKKKAVVDAYNIFYKRKFRSSEERDLLNKIGNAIYESKNETEYKKRIFSAIENSLYDELQKREIENLFYRFWEHKLFFGKQKPFIGHFAFLNHYYRHLYLTVKLVADDSKLSYETKRNLLRILRAQLTDKEQLMLFYNWLSGFGCQWEAMKENKNNPDAVLKNYFTRYRMIHNIYPGDVVFCSKNDEKDRAKEFIHFYKMVCVDENLPPKMCLEKKYGIDNEVLFQFEDWFPKGTLGFVYPQQNDEPQS